MRADAQRNYDRLLEEARQAFIVHGTDVALEDIARHAGVGIGTLYRHFPDRSALMSAVFVRELDALNERAQELLTADDPAAALFAWLKAVAAHSTVYRGMSAQIIGDSDGRMTLCKTRLHEAGRALLARAQAEGAVRSDASMSDLLKLTSGLVLIAEKNPEDLQTFDRLMNLAVNGILVPGGQA
ncbi:MAG: TetR/AcrR family transcriptional regulator [Streptomyces sp.]|nr:TetR/AcrR family transcriptional regulator [Streptomyces sp.]NUS14472.1 TetR/AcrR family transcriptional regulator [Streptomyces sp.]